MRLDRRTLIGAAACAVLPLSARAEETKVTRNNVVELRQYTLHGGRRDELIALFEREFVAPQNALGARILGMFRDLDDPDRFVWLRGFDDMKARAEALEAFYTGAHWRAHREAANATMVDSDNVLLLRPVSDEQDLDGQATARAGAPGIVTATIYYLRGTEPDAFAAFFDRALRPRLTEAGAAPIATLVTEGAVNSFSRLPVREGEPVFVWLSRHADEAAERAVAARLAALTGWRNAAPPAVLPALMRKPERLRLAPTSRSPLR